MAHSRKIVSLYHIPAVLILVLLLDVLPSGDPSQYALPIFLKEPADTFVVKSKPATLHCRVAHAIDIHFQVSLDNPSMQDLLKSILSILKECRIQVNCSSQRMPTRIQITWLCVNGNVTFVHIPTGFVCNWPKGMEGLGYDQNCP